MPTASPVAVGATFSTASTKRRKTSLLLASPLGATETRASPFGVFQSETTEGGIVSSVTRSASRLVFVLVNAISRGGINAAVAKLRFWGLAFARSRSALAKSRAASAPRPLDLAAAAFSKFAVAVRLAAISSSLGGGAT